MDTRAPFRFGGVDYRTPGDLAGMLAAQEAPWLIASDYLGFIRTWFESNLMFEEALRLGDESANAPPELALFRFVHSNATLPFCVMGHVVDTNNIYVFLWYAARGEATEAQSRITDMIGDGRLLSCYDEYARFGKCDATFRDILALLTGKTKISQFACAESLIRPDAYIWPDDAETGDMAGRLGTIRYIGAPPVSRQTLAELTRTHVLPDRLTLMFSSLANYAAAARKLEDLRSEGLLLLKDANEATYRNMSVESYELTAKAICFGHTPDFMMKAMRISSALEELGDAQPSRAFNAAAHYLETMRERKITSSDRAFTDRISELLEDRMAISRLKWCAASSAAIVAIFAICRVAIPIDPRQSDITWTCTGLFALIAAILVFVAKFRQWTESMFGRRNLNRSNVVILMQLAPAIFCAVVMTVFIMPTFLLHLVLFQFIPQGVIHALGLWFPVTGIPLGLSVGNTLYGRARDRNLEYIKNACESLPDDIAGRNAD